MLIMIVDGDASRRRGLCLMLSKRGHTMQSATNRTSAIRILRQTQSKPRLILLDPDCEGASADEFLRVVVERAPEAKMVLLLAPVAV